MQRFGLSARSGRRRWSSWTACAVWTAVPLLWPTALRAAPSPGRLIAPTAVEASTSSPEAPVQRLLDESGLSEEAPGSGRYVHTANKFHEGGTMWNSGYPNGPDTQAWISLDLGGEQTVLGLRVWNYNEKNWTWRGFKEVEISTSADGKAYKTVGRFTFAQATGDDEYAGEVCTDFGAGPFWFIEHAAKRALVLRRLSVNFQGAGGYRNTGRGDLFIEDVVAGDVRFTRQSVWARQLNVENQGTHVLNDGATLWVLGYKTERGGTLIDTRGGGATELHGGFSYTTTAGKLAPMFVVTDSRASFSFAEVCYNNDPYQTLVRETRAGVTRELKRGEKGTAPLFSASPAR